MAGCEKRIVSFIGVGGLLLVVGYFAPLPLKSVWKLREHRLDGQAGCSGLAVWLLCSAAYAQETPADFAVQVPLAVSSAGPWYRLELPLAVQLRARQADLSDVRVFNAAGERRPTRCPANRAA